MRDALYLGSDGGGTTSRARLTDGTGAAPRRGCRRLLQSHAWASTPPRRRSELFASACSPEAGLSDKDRCPDPCRLRPCRRQCAEPRRRHRRDAVRLRIGGRRLRRRHRLPGRPWRPGRRHPDPRHRLAGLRHRRRRRDGGRRLGFRAVGRRFRCHSRPRRLARRDPRRRRPGTGDAALRRGDGALRRRSGRRRRLGQDGNAARLRHLRAARLRACRSEGPRSPSAFSPRARARSSSCSTASSPSAPGASP